MIYNISNTLDIKKSDFLNEIITSKKNDELTPKIIQYFIDMASHAIRHNNLTYPDDRDIEDCIQTALHDLIKYWRNFDSDLYDNPFAFFSSIIFMAYAKEFKNIYNNKFVKNTKKYEIQYSSVPNFDKILNEIDNLHYLILNEIDERNIKRIQIRFKTKGIKSSKWKNFTFDSEEWYDEVESYFTSTIDTIQLKYDYIDGVSFLSLSQGGDSEIYSI
jgi:hypothetical protein